MIGNDGVEPDTARDPGTRSPFVDDEREAHRYHAGRTLPANVLDRWRRAVLPHVPNARPLRIVDVGAGTGIFTAAWPTWVPSHVVGLEPSAAMIGVADRADGASFVRGVAEHLPLLRESVDVIWVSAAVHHFHDAPAAIGEFDRVLTPPGCVLIRTYVRDRTVISWVDELPGRQRWADRFHSADELEALFSAHGFEAKTIVDVTEGSETYEDSARWVERMRGTDSILTALTDDEIDEGLARLRARPDTVGRVDLTLLVFARD